MITSAILALILAHGAASPTTVELGLQDNTTEICDAAYWSCDEFVTSDGAIFVFGGIEGSNGYVSFQGVPYDSSRDVEIVWQVSDENADYNDGGDDQDEWNTFNFNVQGLGIDLRRADRGSDADCFPMEEDYSCDNGGSCNGWRECLDTQRQYMWTLSAQSGALNQVLGRAHSRGRAFFHTRADSPPPSDVWHA